VPRSLWGHFILCPLVLALTYQIEMSSFIPIHVIGMPMTWTGSHMLRVKLAHEQYDA